MQKVMISAGSSTFEFTGEILELEQEYLILKAAHGDIYIERKYLVFIQFLNQPDEQKKIEQKVIPASFTPQKIDAAAKLLNKQLKYDPFDIKIENDLIPPSQLPDSNEEEFVSGNEQYTHSKNTINRPTDLTQAIRDAMLKVNEDEEFSMGPVNYKTPLQTILGNKNADPKKTRNS